MIGRRSHLYVTADHRRDGEGTARQIATHRTTTDLEEPSVVTAEQVQKQPGPCAHSCTEPLA